MVGLGHRGWKLTAVLFGVFMVASVVHLVLELVEFGRRRNHALTATIFVQNFKYNGVPATVPSGMNTFLFQNQESFPITHEMIPIQLPAGKTAQDVIDGATANGAADEDNWLHIGGDFGAVDTGAGIVETLNLPPGNYAFACWQTGTQSGGDNGPPHAPKGMVTDSP